MKVTAYRKFQSEKESALVAYFDIVFKVEWGGWYVRGMKEFTKNGHRFIGHPSEKYINEHGEKKYSSYSGLTDRDCSDKFQIDVLKAIDEFCVKEGNKIMLDNNNPTTKEAVDQHEEVPF